MSENLTRPVVDYNDTHFYQRGSKFRITFKGGTGSRWRSPRPFSNGTVSAFIKCPDGDTSGLCSSFYLASLPHQEEIDFEFLGDKKQVVQTNFFVREHYDEKDVIVHPLQFDTSLDYHEYKIKWDSRAISWYVDGQRIREKLWRQSSHYSTCDDGSEWRPHPMYLYGSVWKPSDHFPADGWVGPYRGRDATFHCFYKDVKVPV